MSIEDISASEIEGVEAEIRARREEYNNRDTVQHHGSVEDISASEIEGVEAEIRARREGYNNRDTVQHHGSVEDISASEIEGVEAEIRARREGYNSRKTEQHYGSVENADASTMAVMEAQVAEQKKKDIPYNEYFNNLVDDPDITDIEQFKSAVSRSMESNRVMNKFINSLSEKIGEKTFQLTKVDSQDREKIQSVKKHIEKLVAVYERYMYELKENEWDFSDLHSKQLPDEIKEDLWQQQKRLDIEFTMPIPADLGEYYGGKFEREGKMIPGITFMYDDLSGKQVNWHQVMIYRENELSPSQRYKQRLIGEITKKQEVLGHKKQELEDLNQQRQQGGNVYGE